MELADSAILPYDVTKLANEIQETLDNFAKNNITQKLEENNASIRFVQEAVNEFTKVTREFKEKVKSTLLVVGQLEIFLDL